MNRKKKNTRNQNFFRNTESDIEWNHTDNDDDFTSDFDHGDFMESSEEIRNITESSDCGCDSDEQTLGRNTNVSRPTRLRGNFTASTCQQLADIIGGMVITSTPVCVVQRLRNINATILSRRTRSPLAIPFALSFENNRNGKTLNLGETVVLQKEINPLLTALRNRGITVTAVHNHWLFEQPRLMYMHWENVGDPFEFAINSFDAASEAGFF